MDNKDLYLAVFIGNKNKGAMKAWMELPEAERQERSKQGIAAWHAWCEKHKDAVMVMGGPLGKTKQVGPNGVADASNDLCGYTIVRAPSHDAASKLFENHPHFVNFPGDCVEIMPIMDVPTNC